MKNNKSLGERLFELINPIDPSASANPAGWNDVDEDWHAHYERAAQAFRETVIDGTETFEEWQRLMRKAINVQNGIASEEDRQIVAEALLRRLDREGFQRITSKLVQTSRNAAR